MDIATGVGLVLFLGVFGVTWLARWVLWHDQRHGHHHEARHRRG